MRYPGSVESSAFFIRAAHWDDDAPTGKMSFSPIIEAAILALGLSKLPDINCKISQLTTFAIDMLSSSPCL